MQLIWTWAACWAWLSSPKPPPTAMPALLNMQSMVKPVRSPNPATCGAREGQRTQRASPCGRPCRRHTCYRTHEYRGAPAAHGARPLTSYRTWRQVAARCQQADARAHRSVDRLHIRHVQRLRDAVVPPERLDQRQQPSRVEIVSPDVPTHNLAMLSLFCVSHSLAPRCVRALERLHVCGKPTVSPGAVTSRDWASA